MPRIKIHTHDAPPCLPQWRNKDGWIAEHAGSGHYRVELEGGDRAVLHETEFYRADNPPEPTTQTVMVGHCPVEVPNSVAQRQQVRFADETYDNTSHILTVAQVNEQQAADWLTITKQVQEMPSVDSVYSMRTPSHLPVVTVKSPGTFSFFVDEHGEPQSTISGWHFLCTEPDTLEANPVSVLLAVLRYISDQHLIEASSKAADTEGGAKD